ncbi:MAG TPA: hypothetical protein VNJ28_03240, partial [Candidatus Limnocylindrales bacterium]|nr:hypothetical protein [Candidatus Limnocylindrales bacterium]
MSALRIVLAVTGAVLAIAGLGTITSDAPGARLGGLVLVLLGGLLVLVAVLERTRYRSEDAERTADLPGPAGG